MGKIILTGDRPTGRLHLGHYVGSLRRRVELQESGEFERIFIMIADAQALTDNADNPEKVRQNIIEVRSTTFRSASIRKVYPFHPVADPGALRALVLLYEPGHRTAPTTQPDREGRDSAAGLRRRRRRGRHAAEAGHPRGLLHLPISQAADITAFKATTVPAGEDQEPMIEQTREIVHKFNTVYGPALVEPEILLPENAVCMRLPAPTARPRCRNRSATASTSRTAPTR